MSYPSFNTEGQIMEKTCEMCGISDSESCFSQGGGLLSVPSPYDNKIEDYSFICFQCDSSNLIECSYCSRIWDGNAQCPCKLYSYDEDDNDDSESEDINSEEDIYREWLQEVPEYESFWVYDNRRDTNDNPEIIKDTPLWHEYNSLGYWDLENSIIEDLAIYNEELELSYYDDFDFDDFDEIDTIPKNITQINDLKEVMDILYDTKEKFPDGDYLKLMNLMNKIYKEL